MSRRTPLLALLALALLAAPASAATPFDVGTGNEPRIAVGADGVGHVVFARPAPTSATADQIGYCRIPKGASACDKTLVLDFPDDGGEPSRGTRASVYAPAPGKVVVASSCYVCVDDAFDDAVLWTSADNGATFGGAQVLGAFNPSADLSGVWLEDANRFVGISGDELKAFQPDTGATVFHSTLDFSYGPEIARLPGTNVLVTATNNLEDVQYSVYEGPGLTSAAINDPANWDLHNPLADEGPLSETGLVSGPAGLYLHYKLFQASNTRMGLRRFDLATKSFGAPVYLDADNPVDDNSLDHPDAHQDASGRIHAVWRTLYDGNRLRYTVSDPAGANFTAPGTLAVTETFLAPEVAAGPDGKGWAVWSSIGQSTPIRAVALEPVPETGLAPPEPEPVTFPSKKPTAKKKGKKVVVKVKGAITPPAGKPCAGQVKIRVKRKKKTIGKATVTVAADCSYKKTLKIRRKKVRKAKRLRVILTFVPADATQVRQTKVSYSVRVR